MTPGAVGPGEIARGGPGSACSASAGRPPTSGCSGSSASSAAAGSTPPSSRTPGHLQRPARPGLHPAGRSTAPGGSAAGAAGSSGPRFIVPGLVAIPRPPVFLADSPPRWVLGAGPVPGGGRRRRGPGRVGTGPPQLGRARSPPAGPCTRRSARRRGDGRSVGRPRPARLRWGRAHAQVYRPRPRSAVIVAGPAVLGSGRDSGGRASAAALTVTASAVGLTGLAGGMDGVQGRRLVLRRRLRHRPASCRPMPSRFTAG